MVTETPRTRTWPVFLLGISALLALLFLPGIIAIRKTASIYQEIRGIQDAHQKTQRLLSGVERQVYVVSITVRELLLDSSVLAGAKYKAAFDDDRREIRELLTALREQTAADSRNAVAKLDQELEGYLNAIEPVFGWTPAERAARGTYFLREQQRPRRQSVIAIAEEIGHLTEASYSRQLEKVNQSQIRFGEDMRRVIVVVFLLGLGIAGITVARILTLEERAERHRLKTEKAEDELRSLSTQLMHAQEEERKRISRELHDEVGQTLTGLRMGLGGLDRMASDPDGLHEQIAEVKGLAEQALRSVRDIAVGLRPSVLDLGLVPALRWQARRFSKYAGIPVTVHTDGELEGVPEDCRTCVYRVVQECLTNAVKHSGAKSVQIEVHKSGGLLEVSVRDDGTGFRNGDASDGGLGLLGMEERVRELGGTLRVRSDPAAGTTVQVRLAVSGPTS